jgi:hypothetical protein
MMSWMDLMVVLMLMGVSIPCDAGQMPVHPQAEAPASGCG